VISLCNRVQNDRRIDTPREPQLNSHSWSIR